MVAALVLSATVWPSVPAAAHFLNHRDPDDSNSSLDLRSVHLWEYEQDGLYSVVIRTYDVVNPNARPVFVAWLDTFGSHRWDYAVTIGRHSSQAISRSQQDPGIVLFAGRIDPRKAHLLFQTDDAFRQTKHIRLRVWARRDQHLHARRGLVDRAPNTGWFEH